jgi:Bacterial protein of unknown function (DUF839)
MFKIKYLALSIALAFSANAAQAADLNPDLNPELNLSTTVPSYLVELNQDTQFIALLTTGDAVKGYRMAGIPDGLGAYDNDDGTFTVLMNHEIADPLGIVRAHGGKGAFVSEWVINKKTLAVESGADLIKRAYVQTAPGVWSLLPETGVAGKTSSFSRFCAADLADKKAFYNKKSNLGTKQRIFLNGEESAPTYQRGLAHVATGPNKGKSYVLPWTEAANASWENLVANPYSGDKTVLVGTADGGTGGVYVYAGKKSKLGNEVEKAGLVDGAVYRVAVNGNVVEDRTANAGLGLTVNARGNYAGAFSLIAGADTANAASTRFLRPEDGDWDTVNKNRFYFVTTDRPDAAKDGDLNTDIPTGQIGRSRLWALTFVDSAKPALGGQIELMLDGTSAKSDYQMFDNITVNDDGTLTLQEDIGNNQHNGKVWQYDPKSGSLVKIAKFDSALFGDIGVAGSLTKDEESSGVIDITDILDREDDYRYSLLAAQNHAKSTDTELVEGGQLLLMIQKETDDEGDDKRQDK